MADDDQGVQRSLGRIEGDIRQILTELKNIRDDFGDHKNDDQKNFSLARTSNDQLRADMLAGFSNADNARGQHLGEQDVRLERIERDANRAKGAGWVILGLLGSLATFLGAAVIAALSGHIKFH